MTVEMTAQNISDFHQKLTIYYNDHYDDIENQKEDPYGIIEDEVNQDHGNDNNI